MKPNLMGKDMILQEPPQPLVPKPLKRQIFVAYAYNIYPEADYRKIFSALEKAYGVKFIFADEKITNLHILQKIISYIDASDFSLFDISGWNPNVTLELGLAYRSDSWYIAFNPDKTPVADVPSDIKGIDRIQYKSFTELEEKLSLLLEQRYPKQVQQPLESFLDEQREKVVSVLRENPGLKMNQIAEILGIEVKTAQVLVSKLVSLTLRVEGQRRGARYYVKDG
jgi:predicted nucleotide-binding protein